MQLCRVLEDEPCLRGRRKRGGSARPEISADPAFGGHQVGARMIFALRVLWSARIDCSEPRIVGGFETIDERRRCGRGGGGLDGHGFRHLQSSEIAPAS